MLDDEKQYGIRIGQVDSTRMIEVYRRVRQLQAGNMKKFRLFLVIETHRTDKYIFDFWASKKIYRERISWNNCFRYSTTGDWYDYQKYPNIIEELKKLVVDVLEAKIEFSDGWPDNIFLMFGSKPH